MVMAYKLSMHEYFGQSAVGHGQAGQAMESCLRRIAMIADENHVEFIVVLSDKAAELALVCTDKMFCDSCPSDSPV